MSPADRLRPLRAALAQGGRLASRAAPRRATRSALRAAFALALALAALAGAAARAAPAQQQPPLRIFLPAVSRPSGPPAAVRFGAGLADGALTGAGTAFDAGLTTLYYEVTVAGGAGLPFRLAWTVGGQRRPELDRAGLLPADGGPLTGGIALSTAAPLPAGAYQLHVFVAGLSSGAGQATIR